MPSNDKAQTLFDIYEIQKILSKYVIAVDSKEFGLFDQCFTEDAEIELANTGVFTKESYKQLCSQALPNLDATQHHLGLPIIEVDGDKASSRCYFVAQHVSNKLAPKPFLIIGGWYNDQFARVKGEWRITRRQGVAVWFDGNPDVLGYPFPPGALASVPGRECPGWLLSR
jgi:hypothetical protein